jgi:hypothetical protein
MHRHTGISPAGLRRLMTGSKAFLNTTVTMNIRKVAVFDSDGTTFGQVPYYLADEALYRYADVVLKERKDREAKTS